MKIIKLIIIYILFIFYFYRSPKIKTNINLLKNNYIVSPSFGTVMDIIENVNNYHICIFLSPLDVHIQYFPTSGYISNIIYDDIGRFDLAYKINKSRYNEKCIHTLITKYGKIIIYQIAGFFVRNIQHYKNIGDNVNICDKLGMINFGSRVDIILPKISNVGFCKLLVTKNNYVKGGTTKIAQYI